MQFGLFVNMQIVFSKNKPVSKSGFALISVDRYFTTAIEKTNDDLTHLT